MSFLALFLDDVFRTADDVFFLCLDLLQGPKLASL